LAGHIKVLNEYLPIATLCNLGKSARTLTAAIFYLKESHVIPNVRTTQARHHHKVLSSL
jgi:hypothetical protein